MFAGYRQFWSMIYHAKAVWEIWIEGGDKWVMSKFWRTAILRPFFDIFERLLETQNFFCEKLPPRTANIVFENPKAKPCDSIWSHNSKMVEHLGISNIFCKYLVKNIFRNIFSNFLKKYFQKYFQYLSVISFWNRETKCHHMALIKTWFEEIFFSTSKGGTLWIFKNGFCNAGGLFFKQKKFCVSRSLSNMSKNGLRMVVRLNFGITHLSPPL